MLKNDDHLEHHGVPGMKWGVRKKSNRLTLMKVRKQRRVEKNKERFNRHKSQVSELIKKQKAKSDGVKNMSDDELRKKINRLNLEKQYKDLNRSTVSSGRKAVNEILTSSMRSVAKEATRTAIGTTLNTVTGVNLVNTSKKDKK